MSPDTQSATQVGVLAGEDWQVTCHTYKLTTPILTIRAGSATVSVSIRRHQDMPSSGVAFARELVRQAGRFAAECERLYALHTWASADNSTPEQPLAAGRRA